MPTQIGLGNFVTDSTLLFAHRLSEGLQEPDATAVVELTIQRLIDARRCPICDAPPRARCKTFGGSASLMRTHYPRLKVTDRERALLVQWARDEHIREPEAIRH